MIRKSARSILVTAVLLQLAAAMTNATGGRNDSLRSGRVAEEETLEKTAATLKAQEDAVLDSSFNSSLMIKSKQVSGKLLVEIAKSHR